MGYEIRCFTLKCGLMSLWIFTIYCLCTHWSVGKRWNDNDLSDFLHLYDLQRGTRHYSFDNSIWASHPERDIRGKWPLCEFGELWLKAPGRAGKCTLKLRINIFILSIVWVNRENYHLTLQLCVALRSILASFSSLFWFCRPCFGPLLQLSAGCANRQLFVYTDTNCQCFSWRLSN